MQPLTSLVKTLIALRQSGRAQITLLAVCPNSEAVLEAAVRCAAHNNLPMLLAATLNQVDRDGGYTGWTPAQFVASLKGYAQKYSWDGPLYPCLDHGGPWLKDRHTLERLSYSETMAEVKASLRACLQAGYQLLHIDPTVDRDLPPGQPLPVETVVARTVELLSFAEAERQRLGLPPVAYEVGSEEVHGGLVDFAQFTAFLQLLRQRLAGQGLSDAWPCFIVAQVGTDLHTVTFNSPAAERLYELLAPTGALVKGHYTDFVDAPHLYPASGMGGANLGPELTAVEVQALRDLEARERQLSTYRPGVQASGFSASLEAAVVASGRWRKWLQPQEAGLEFAELTPDRRAWLVETGARYVWVQPEVLAARRQLYANLSPVLPDPSGFVVSRLTAALEKYVLAFNLFDSLSILGE